MRGAIVGFGTIALGHLHAYSSLRQLSVSAVADPSPSRRAHARELGLVAYDDLDALLAEQEPEFLDVCTPPDSHGAYIERALERDLPVLCEKPVFLPSVTGYGELLRRLRESGTVVYPCQNYKFAPIFARAREILADGRLGEVRSVRVDIARVGHARGVPDWRADWRREREISFGGILRDHGPHAVYTATSMTGLRPRSVSALLGSLDRAGAWDTEDTALVRVRCAGDADIELRLSWAAGFRDSRYLFVGTRGFLHVDNDRLAWSADGGLRQEQIRSDFDDPSHRSWFADMFREFHAMVRDPAGEAARLARLQRESVMVSSVLDAGYESGAADGAWVDLPPDAAAAPEGRA